MAEQPPSSRDDCGHHLVMVRRGTGTPSAGEVAVGLVSHLDTVYPQDFAWREEGEWIPNEWGGNEDVEAIKFLRELNGFVHEEAPGALMIAEDLRKAITWCGEWYFWPFRTEEVEQSYTVMVPYQEDRTGTRMVCEAYQETLHALHDHHETDHSLRLNSLLKEQRGEIGGTPEAEERRKRILEEIDDYVTTIISELATRKPES